MKIVPPYKGDKSRSSNDLNTTACTEGIILSGEEDKYYYDELEALQEDYYVVKCKKISKGNCVLVSGGTRYGSSKICTFKVVNPKTLWLVDSDGNEFWKNKGFCKKINFFTDT